MWNLPCGSQPSRRNSMKWDPKCQIQTKSQKKGLAEESSTVHLGLLAQSVLLDAHVLHNTCATNNSSERLECPTTQKWNPRRDRHQKITHRTAPSSRASSTTHSFDRRWGSRHTETRDLSRNVDSALSKPLQLRLCPHAIWRAYYAHIPEHTESRNGYRSLCPKVLNAEANPH